MLALLIALLAAPPSFPVIKATSLAGVEVTAPGGLPGTTRVILTSFARDNAPALDAWFDALLPLERVSPGLYVVEAPVIGDVNPFLEAMIVGAQQLSIPAAKKARYLPLFVDKRKVMAALQVTDERACVAVVMDRRGAVIAVVTGAASKDNVALVQAALAGATVAP